MGISYKDVRSERQWKSATGLTEIQFIEVAEKFGQMYEKLFGESIIEREFNSTNDSRFRDYRELLFFGLYSLKSGLSYDLLGLSFGIGASTAYENQSVVLRVLESTLSQMGHMPARAFASEEDFAALIANEPTLLLDVTEQRTQRPDNQEEQKMQYSGKKKHIP